MNDYRKLYATPRWARLRRFVKDRDGWRCRECGKAGRLEVDHILPVRLGGDFWDVGNLQTLDRSCHFAKSARENSRRKHKLMPVHRREWRDMVEDILNKY